MPCAPLVFSDSFPPLYQKLFPIEVLCKKTDPHHILSTRKQGKWKLLVISQKQGCTTVDKAPRLVFILILRRVPQPLQTFCRIFEAPQLSGKCLKVAVFGRLALERTVVQWTPF